MSDSPFPPEQGTGSSSRPDRGDDPFARPQDAFAGSPQAAAPRPGAVSGPPAGPIRDAFAPPEAIRNPNSPRTRSTSRSLRRRGGQPSPRRDGQRGSGEPLRSWPRLFGFSLPVLLIALVSGVLAGLSGAAPTAIATWNIILTGVIAAIVTLIGASSPRWALLLLACTATAFSGVGAWTVCGLVAIVIAIAMIILDERDTVVAAVAAALGVQVVLRLPSNWFFGFESIVAGVLIAVIVWTGYRKMAGPSRRVMRQILLIGAFASAFSVFVAAVVVIDARGPAQAGVSAAQLGLQSARSGDVNDTLGSLDSARQSFLAAENTLDATWAAPARLVPVVSQHMRLLRVASANGTGLTDAASRTVRDANINELSLANGAVDVATLTSLAPNLERLAAEMAESRVEIAASRSPWIIPQLDRRVDGFVGELDRAAPEADLAAAASRVVPDLLGASGNRNYMVLFGSPSESREFGGFVGSWAMVEASNGALTKVTSGRAIDLYDQARAGQFDDPDGYPQLFLEANPGRWPQNLTSMPLISEVARAAADLFPELEGRSIDGVIYLDPYVVQGLLELIGPLQIDGSDVVLTGDNAAQFLITEQYRAFDDDALSSERHQFLSDTFDATFAALTTSTLPGPERLGEVLGPLAREGRVQFATFDDEANAFLKRIFLLQELGDPAETDVLSVVHVNGTANKLDAFLTRDVQYRALVDPVSREFSGEVLVDLTLDVPDDAPPYVFGVEGRNGDYAVEEHRVLLSIYTPHDLVWAGVDGEPEIARAENEFGLRRYIVPVLLHADDRTSATVRFVLEGALPPGDAYVLDVANQPLVNRDQLQIELTNIVSGESTGVAVELDQDLRLTWPLVDQ